jgi:hypothetical protein
VLRVCATSQMPSQSGLMLKREYNANYVNPFLPKFVLPTNTTWTDAQAAVAANISIGLAFVKIASTMENSIEKPRTTHSLVARSWIKYKTMTAVDGKSVDSSTAITLAIPSLLDSGNGWRNQAP